MVAETRVFERNAVFCSLIPRALSASNLAQSALRTYIEHKAVHSPKKPVYPSSCHRSGWLVLVLCSLALPLSSSNGALFFNDWAATNLNTVPTQSGPTNDPDSDGAANLAEFAFGTDPLVGTGLGNAITTIFGGTNGFFGVELFEQAGHVPGVQIDVDATVDMAHWIRPWWLRTLTNSLPGDPPGSVRERLTTYLPGTNIFIVRGDVTLLQAGPETAKYYIATNGNDSALGTNIALPFATLGKAVGLANPGDLIYVRGGTYAMSSKLVFTRSGTPAQPIRLRAYPGESPILDCTAAADGTDCLVISGNCWRVYGLMITNSGHNSIRIMRDSNVVERCISYGARNTGFHISGGDVPSTIFPASNLFLNCDSIRNYDAPVGGNADGFTAKWNIGPGNVFSGCRAWENSDDGWDLWMGTSTVLITNCWSFRNASNVFNSASFNGDGNGFKLGGNYVATPHRIVNCLSFNNRTRGYDQNNNMGTLTVDNNTAWNNPTSNFQLNHPSTSTPHIVRNNLSVAGGPDSIRAGSVLLSNSWQIITSPPPGTNDFLSMDTSWAVAPRRDDGGLPEVPLMRPVPGGRLVDQGTTNVGIAYYGSAPDLGAFESPTWDGLH